MLKIIEKVINSPIRMPLKPGIRVKSGMVGRLIEWEGNIVIDIANGNNGIGLIGNNRFISGDKISFDKEDLVSIWPQRMIFRTNVFADTAYMSGQALYVGDDGILTPDLPRENIIQVARLTKEPETGKKSYIECLWL